MMKTLSFMALVFLLAGCAAPYYSVPVSSKGEYYIAERRTGGSYYSGNSLLYDDLGIHPWWMGTYPVELFSYYSPYYYPHYFSVWQPPGFHPFHGFYGRYYAYWCPPYRPRLYRREPDASHKVVTRPVVRPPAIVTYPNITELRKWNDLAAVSRPVTSRGVNSRRPVAWGTESSAGSLPVFGRSVSSPARSAGIGRSAPRSGSTRTARPIAGKPYATQKH